MKLEELRSRVTHELACTGTYRVTIEYRGKFYHCFSHNTLAVDRIWHTDDDGEPRRVVCGYTEKQAYLSLWRECLLKNNLGIYSYLTEYKH